MESPNSTQTKSNKATPARQAPQTDSSRNTSFANSSNDRSNMANGGAEQTNMNRNEVSENGSAKSIRTVLSQSLAQEGQEEVERLLSQVSEYFEAGKEYVHENPREAAGLAISVGIATWALLGTKPGRKVFEAGSAIAIPHMAKWVSRNFSGVKH